MQAIVDMLFGAAVLASFIGVGYLSFLLLRAVRKTWAILEKLALASEAAKDAVQVNKNLLSVASTIAVELSMLRTVMVNVQQPTAGEEEVPGFPGSRKYERGAIPEFPDYVNQYRPVTYEATEEETDIADTPDEKMAELEKIEEIRGAGYEVESDELPPGVVAQA